MRKPRIRSVLLLVNFFLLLLPLGGLWVLKVYESALVRQTETELIAQAAVIGASYRVAWGAAPAVPGQWAPRPAVLDLATDPILPAPDLPVAAAPPDPRALAAGASLQQVLAEAQLVTLAAMRVVDRAGVIVATSREELGLSMAAQSEVAAALAGRPAAGLRARVALPEVGLLSISRNADFRVFVALPVLDASQVIGAVVLSRTPVSLGQALYGKRWEIALLSLALLLAAALLALFTAYTVSRPIQQVAAQARAVAGGARASPGRTRRSAIREADELWAAIHTMAATLERRADYIGSFAAEVSHEFKTPLSALRGALELLQDHAMTEEERARFLDQASADVARLDRLVRRLLDLARAEAPAPRRGESCDLPAVVAALHPGGEGPPVRAAIAAEILRTVLANLLDNVRQHAGPGATARIGWSVEDSTIRLTVADNGRGISTGNLGKVFGRFFTTAREEGGTGLGLSIVRSHLEAAGGRIELLPGGPGATFVLTIPRGAD